MKQQLSQPRVPAYAVNRAAEPTPFGIKESTMETIAGAGNCEVPAYLTLRKLGFEVTAKADVRGAEQWTATRDDLTLIGEGPLELLGLYLMRTERGMEWKASDPEITAFMNRFYPEER